MNIVIPASMKSKRLPGKPLLVAGGKSLLQWTYERAREVSDSVIIATGNTDVSSHCKSKGISHVLSSGSHSNGTSRVWEAIANYHGRLDFPIVNWQVDEPLLAPNEIRRLDQVDSSAMVWTLVSLLNGREKSDPNTVKVILIRDGVCQWFSRASMAGAFGHCGIYCYLTSLPLIESSQNSSRNTYSESEGLEQLDWIEAGISIKAKVMDELPLSINTKQDWDKFKSIVEG